MIDPIGLTLAAVGLLDPAYTRIRTIWDGCKTIEEFGKIFNEFASSVKAQQDLFFSSRDIYQEHVKRGGVGRQWINQELRDDIENHAAVIATKLEACYALAHKYQGGDKANEADEASTKSTASSSESRSELSKERRQNFGSKWSGRFRERFTKKAHRKRSSENATRPIQRQTEELANILQSPAAIKFNARCEKAQRDLSGWKGIKFADHDRAKMREWLGEMSQKNEELSKLVRLPELGFESPLLKIRKDAAAPTLWKESELIRNDLYSLQEALKVTNADTEDSAIKLAIRLEEDQEHVLYWANENKFDKGLRHRLNPNFFRLLALSPARVSEHELLVAGTISYSRHSVIDDGGMPETLREALESPGTPGDNYVDVGDIALDNQRIFNIRRIIHRDQSESAGEQTLDDIVDKDWSEFSYGARIRLAARIALAHLRFSSANPGFQARQTKNYRFFGVGSERTWTNPWLDNGFGSPGWSMHEGQVRSLEDIVAGRVNAAKELGRLLYQITSSSKLGEGLPQNLDSTCIEGLSNVEKRCGLDVMLIVKACFCELPRLAGQRQPEYVIVEEVAYALQRLVDEVKEVEKMEAAIIRAMASAETVTGKQTEEQTKEQVEEQLMAEAHKSEETHKLEENSPTIIKREKEDTATENARIATGNPIQEKISPQEPTRGRESRQQPIVQGKENGSHFLRTLSSLQPPRHEPESPAGPSTVKDRAKIAA